MIEIWKPVAGFENFEVSSLGRVRNVALGIIKLQRPDTKGYMMVDLKESGQKRIRYVHRLVGEAFIENPAHHPQINHKDENKANNHVNNLEWCTVAYNNTYNGRAKRVGKHHQNNHPKRKKVICTCTGMIFSSVREAARKTGICNVSISYALSGKQQTAGGYKWEVAM